MEYAAAPTRRRTGAAGGGGAANGERQGLRPRINFSRLDINSLRRYQRTHKLSGLSAAATKNELVAAVQQHFGQQAITGLDELLVITGFVMSMQRRQGQALGRVRAAANGAMQQQQQGYSRQ